MCLMERCICAEGTARTVARRGRCAAVVLRPYLSRDDGRGKSATGMGGPGETPVARGIETDFCQLAVGTEGAEPAAVPIYL